MNNSGDSSSLTARVGRGMVWNLCGKTVVTALSFILSVVIARGLSPVEFGMFSLVWAVYMALLLVGSLGVDTGLMKYLPESKACENKACARELVGAAVAAKLLVLLLVSGVLVVASDFVIGRMFREARLPTTYLYVIPGLLVPCGLNSLFRSVLESQYRQRLVNLVDMLQIISRLAAVSLGLWWQPVVMSVLLGNLVIEWGILVIYAVAARDSVRWPGAGWTPQVRKLAGFSAALWVMSLANFLIGKTSDLLLLGAFADPRVVGMYNLAYTFALQAYMVMTLPLGNLALVAASELYGNGDKQRLTKAAELLLKYHLLFVPPICLGGIVLAGPMLRCLYGPSYLEATTLLQLYMAVFAIGVLFLGPFTTLLTSIEQQRVLMISSISFGVANLLLNVFLVPRFGAIGALTGTGLINILNVIWLGFLLRRKMPWQFPVGFAIKTAVAAGAMGGALFLVSGWATTGLYLTLIILLCIVVYALVLKVTNPFSGADLGLLRQTRLPVIRRLIPILNPESSS